MVNPSEFLTWLIAWMICLLLTLWASRKDGTGSGLVISYVLQLWVIHWLAAAIYALPWYRTPDLPMLYGLRQSTYAIAGFGLGSTVIVPFVFRRYLGMAAAEARNDETADKWLVHAYLLVGVVTFFVLEPMLHSIPTVSAVASSASNLLIVALAMECWNGLQTDKRQQQSFWRWVLLSALLPFMTIATKGFLSYGFAAMLTVFSFVATFYRPRWKMVFFAAIIGYLALSMYVTYMRDRRDIRAVVWRQETYASRVSAMVSTFSNFEFLDLRNPDHLLRIDDRLNQNALLGVAVANLEVHPEQFANGRTIWEAVLSPIPRVLWPTKRIAAGSGDLVSEFTGIRFGEDTSVGIGHVMEWYVNFGSYGVFFGMLGLGVLIGWMDRNAAIRIARGEWASFTFWWLPGLSLLQVGGSLVEAVSGGCASLAVAVMISRFRRSQERRQGRHRPPLLDQAAARPRLMPRRAVPR
ncbi:MAG TPA: hypothetical protein VL309_10085 [Vicinamibacterales bacterium]|jgi:hypothetical protein|nr:hypothetical protein [Vicinamibacterales bacterium]